MKKVVRVRMVDDCQGLRLFKTAAPTAQVTKEKNTECAEKDERSDRVAVSPSPRKKLSSMSLQ